MNEKIRAILEESSAVKKSMAENAGLRAAIEQAATAIKGAVSAGGTIYSCGNGGSTCDAMHFTEELVARFKRERPGMRAMHFMDSSVLTCWSNDYDFQGAFERQAQTFCTDKDVLIGISTSGNSENVLRAVRAAKEKGTYCIGFAGKDGGKLAKLADLALVVPANTTERIQEGHITIVHILCELLEA